MARKIIFLVSIAVAVISLDQWTKYLIVKKLTTRLDSARSLPEALHSLYSDPPPLNPITQLHFVPKILEESPGHQCLGCIVLSPEFFELRYAENPGAAWGLFRDLPEGVRGPLFHFVSLGAVILITYYFVKLTGAVGERWAVRGLPLVLGGAIGNYVDRLGRGFVVDYLEAHWHHRVSWPSFNVADTAICIGVGMLFLDAIVRKQSRSPASVQA